MDSRLDPTQKTTCMVCRTATARYYGSWAAEGLCRECILRMSPEIRIKVLRDMHPADRKRWQLDGLLDRGNTPPPRSAGSAAPAGEADVAKLLEATEKGSDAALEEAAAKVGARVVPIPKPPQKT